MYYISDIDKYLNLKNRKREEETFPKEYTLRCTEKFLKEIEKKDRKVLREYFLQAERYYAGNRDVKKFLRDEIRSVQALLGRGIGAQEIASRLCKTLQSDFYREKTDAYCLDTAAKLYPLVMGRYASSIFRLSVWLKEDVSPQLLQCAFNRVRPRFPSFSVVLKKGVVWHYLDGYNGHCSVVRDSDVPCCQIRLSAAGSVPMRVVFYKNRIGVEFFHALTDGTGALIFLKTLLGEYLRLCGENVVYDNGVLDPCAPVQACELADGFAQIKSLEKGGGMEERPALQIEGGLSFRRARAYHFVCGAEKLKERAKACGITVTALLIGYIARASFPFTKEKGKIRFQIPVNVRKFYGLQTCTNCAMFACIELEKIGEKQANQGGNEEDVYGEIERQLKEKTSKSATERGVVKAVNLVRRLRRVPLFFKRPAAKLYNAAVTKNAFTHILSNLGVARLPEAMAKHIDMLDFIIGAPSKNSGYFSCITFGDKAVLSYTTSNKRSDFEEKLLQILESDGISVTVYGGRNYEN